MSILDDTLLTAKGVWDAASKKTTEAVEVQKLRFAIAKKKSELSHAFETLGRTYYHHAASGGMEEPLEQMIQSAGDTMRELKALENQLEEAKNRQTCPACGQKNPVGACYCNRCGAPFAKEEPAADAAAEPTVDQTAEGEANA